MDAMSQNEMKDMQEPYPVGDTTADQQRNAALLSDYDYGKYPAGITGYTGQNLQRIMTVSFSEAIRTRVGPRGNYKAGFTRLSDGTLLVAVCTRAGGDKNAPFRVDVFDSKDEMLSWRKVTETKIIGKEPSLATLPDGTVVMTAQYADFSADAAGRGMYVARSSDGGETWDVQQVPGPRYPRNVIVEDDGSLLFFRPTSDLSLQACRSNDGGRTWRFTEGAVDWRESDRNTFDEVSAIRLGDGTLLAALRHEIAGCQGEGFEDTLSSRSTDDGQSWSTPVRMVNTAEVHVFLTQLSDGRILASYSNYHLPYGACAIVSGDGGRTWDRNHPIQLSLSADLYVGWPVTLELPGGDLVTSYASTTYVEEPPHTTTCEVVRWRLPR